LRVYDGEFKDPVIRISVRTSDEQVSSLIKNLSETTGEIFRLGTVKERDRDPDSLEEDEVL
jgi:hypothetical protein